MNNTFTHWEWVHNKDSRNKITMQHTLSPSSIEELKEYVREIYRSRKSSFKLNLYLSGFLDALDQAKTISKPIWGTALYQGIRGDTGPRHIHNLRTLNEVLEDFTEEDFRRVTAKMIEKSASHFIGIPRFWIRIYHVGQKMGNGEDVPKDILNSNLIKSMVLSKNNMCFFDCLAQYYNPEKKSKRLMKERKKYFRLLMGEIDDKDFEGVTTKQVSDFQEKLDLTINIFNYENNKNNISLFQESEYVSNSKKTMDLLKCKEHFMLIKEGKKEQVLQKAICDKCGTPFNQLSDLIVHQKGLACRLAKKIEKQKHLKELAVTSTKDSDLKMLYLENGLESEYEGELSNICTYDIETSTEKSTMENTSEASKLFFEGQQVPMSISVCFDFGKGKVTKTLLIGDKKINFNPFKLVKKFVDMIVKISIISFNIYKEKHSRLYNKLSDKDKVRFINATALPVIGFNSGKFDTRVMKYFGLIQYLQNHKLWINFLPNYTRKIDGILETFPGSDLTGDKNWFAIDNKIISKNTIRLVDQMLWLGACDLNRFIKSYNPEAEIGKLVFPHSTFNYKEDCPKIFNKENFPRVLFYNTLKNQELDEETYDKLFVVAKEKNVKTMQDYLVLYNECDVIPFLEACVIFRNQIRETTKEQINVSIEPYQETLGAPALAYKILLLHQMRVYKTKHDIKWKLNYNEEKDIFDPKRTCNIKIIKKNFMFYQNKCKSYEKQDEEKNRKTKITEKWMTEQYKKQDGKCFCCHKKLTQKNLTFDRINNNFGHSDDNMVMSCESCNVTRKTGSLYLFEYYQRKADFEKEYQDVLMCTGGETEKDIYNLLRERGINGGPSIVFHRFHKCFETHIQHAMYDKINDEFYLGEKKGLVKFITSLDANALYSWAMSMDMPCGRGRLLKIDEKNTKEKVLEKIMDDTYYGFVQFTAHVDKDNYNKYAMFPPFFITQKINGQEKLSSYLDCEDMLAGTPLFKWYMSQEGIILDDIKLMILYNRAQPFKEFCKLAANMRRDKKNVTKAELWKLFVNACFGKFGQNNSKFSNKVYTTCFKKASRLVGCSNFKNLTEHHIGNTTLFEIDSSKMTVNHAVPLHAACLIHSNAKLRMLDFVYNCVDKYISRDCYQPCTMDTDSFVAAYSEENPFETLIKPELKEEFEKDKYNWFVYDDEYTRESAKNGLILDVRTVGLFKIEMEMDSICALASKSYACTPSEKEIKNNGNKCKIAQKGVQKSNVMTIDLFKEVLSKHDNNVIYQNLSAKERQEISNNEHQVTNRGFRVNPTGGLQRYVQNKVGVTSKYDKRH